ncbi:MAG: TonB-dependent siderophore receptor [Gammaproteobacteria bacterium]
MKVSNKKHARFVIAVVAALLGVAGPGEAAAQTSLQAQALVHFDIPAGPLGAALGRFAEVTRVQLVYGSDLTQGLRSPGLKGAFTPRDALVKLLQGTGLTARMLSATSATLEKAAPNGARVLDPVRVEGAQANAAAGFNGGTDQTATEGTGSYTSGALSIGSKTPQSMKDTPQSVSVLTAQRMKDQNITDFNSAVNQLPGVTAVQLNGLESTFYSRGFAITSIQVDGGAAFMTGNSNVGGLTRAYEPQIDMAQYDHVELLRGADGQFNFYGDPSGSINLVRKRPLNHRQVSVEAQSGSWGMRRAVLDATSPLALDDEIRGRLVLAYQSNDHFYDIAEDNKTLVYGTLEYDVSASTLLSGGISYTRQNSVPWFNGLPRYQSGADLDLPRDTCLCFPWNRWNFETTEIFGQIEQHLGEHWRAKLNLTDNRQSSEQLNGLVNGTVNPTTLAGPALSANRTNYGSEQRAADVTLSGTFELFGQRQEILIGASYAKIDGSDVLSYSSAIPSNYVPYPGGPVGPPPVNVFNFDVSDPRLKAPTEPLPAQRQPLSYQENSGAYVSVKLTAFDRLHLVTGVRYSRYDNGAQLQDLCTTTTGDCAGKQIGDNKAPGLLIKYADNNFSWPPQVSVLYDFRDSLTAYVTYADIYKSQAQSLTMDMSPLEPLTGANYETGVKWQGAGGKLNASLSAYWIEQKNFGMAIPGTQLRSVGIKTCCYTDNPDQKLLSRGVDAEVTGELLTGWQVAASYTWNQNEYSGRYYAARGAEGIPLVSRSPRSLVKLWTSYRPASAGALGRLTLSGGVTGQSSAFQAGTACTVFNPPNPATGAITCKTSVPYNYTQKGYVVWSARLGYDLNAIWNVGLNANNVTDQRYYQTMGSSTGGNWYGEPRSYMLSLHGTF